MDRERTSRGVVVAPALEVLAQRQYQLRAVRRVVADQPGESLVDKALHRGGVVPRGQHLVDPEVVVERGLFLSLIHISEPTRRS